MKTKLILLFLLIFMWAFGKSQDTIDLSINKARNYAIENNFKIKKNQTDITIAKKQVKETTGIGMPHISATGSFRNNTQIATNVFPNFVGEAIEQQLPNAPPGPEFIEAQFGTEYNVNAGLTINQLLFDASYLTGIKASKTFKKYSKDKLKKSKNEIKSEVSKAYIKTLVIKEKKTILKKIHKSVKNTYNETRALFQEGLIDEEEKDQMKLNLHDIESRFNNADRNYQIAKNALKLKMGMKQEKNIKLKEKIDQLLSIEENKDLLSKKLNIKEHPSHQVIETQLKLKELDIQKEKSKFIPSLNALFTTERSAQRNQFNFFDSKGKWFPNTFWGINLSIPIFSGGQRFQRMKKAQLEKKKTLTQKKQVKQTLKMQVENTRSKYLNAIKKMKNKKKSLELAQNIHNKKIEKFKEGMTSSLDVTQTKKQLLDIETQYIQSISDVLNSRLKLKKALNSF